MTKTKEFIQTQLATLDRGFIATPESADVLEAFARANNGSMDIVLMQMAIQFGYRQALEAVAETLPESRVNADTRVDFLENALSYAWNMGRGANTIDMRDVAQSTIADMFGE